MKFQSTRDSKQEKFTSAQVIRKGLADDGGLFVPESIPTLTHDEINALCGMKYAHRAAYILGKYLTDYTHEELLADCSEAYSETSFVGGAAPLRKIGENMYTQELWHGPTAAFKDMALQIMPRLLSRALKKTGEQRKALILVATSGDTGKAALEGYRDVDQVCISVFYPVNGVSKIQKMQMVTQLGENVNVCAIYGNFDDAQTGVKKIFADSDAAKQLDDKGFFLSSANSINWGRLAPQIVYYVSAYCDLLNQGALEMGEVFNVCVPTGNFGNIFAAYLAKLMGLPIGKLICASNKNNILTDFLQTGTYDRNRQFHLTMSPSMDILISSNLERLLYFTAGPEQTKAYMQSLNQTGAYTVSNAVKEKIDADFCGYYADEVQTAQTIRKYQENGYLMDTHTAVAVFCAEQFLQSSKEHNVPLVIASTASPYKFAADVYTSLGKDAPEDALKSQQLLSDYTGTQIPYPLVGLGERAVRFDKTVHADQLLEEVLRFADSQN